MLKVKRPFCFVNAFLKYINSKWMQRYQSTKYYIAGFFGSQHLEMMLTHKMFKWAVKYHRL